MTVRYKVWNGFSNIVTKQKRYVQTKYMNTSHVKKNLTFLFAAKCTVTLLLTSPDKHSTFLSPDSTKTSLTLSSIPSSSSDKEIIPTILGRDVPSAILPKFPRAPTAIPRRLASSSFFFRSLLCLASLIRSALALLPAAEPPGFLLWILPPARRLMLRLLAELRLFFLFCCFSLPERWECAMVDASVFFVLSCEGALATVVDDGCCSLLDGGG